MAHFAFSGSYWKMCRLEHYEAGPQFAYPQHEWWPKTAPAR